VLDNAEKITPTTAHGKEGNSIFKHSDHHNEETTTTTTTTPTTTTTTTVLT
jgi:hypothetical protein